MSDIIDVAFPVRWYVEPDGLAKLQERAKELDDENLGEHLKHYTTEQAITVVLHVDPKFLFACLDGWCHDGDGHALWDGGEWEVVGD